MYQVGIYGFLLGTVGGGLGRFTPLFAEEAVGFSPAAAGLVFGLSGLVAIPTRIVSGAMLDRGVSARATLIGMAVVGATATLITWSAIDGPDGLVWAGAVLTGMSLGSWNTAANLAMIRQTGNTGRASGVLLLGFLLGLTAGGPVVGWSIDTFDSYTPAWLAAAGVALVGAALVAVRPARRADQRSPGAM